MRKPRLGKANDLPKVTTTELAESIQALLPDLSTYVPNHLSPTTLWPLLYQKGIFF
jgi:hypothetical protein